MPVENKRSFLRRAIVESVKCNLHCDISGQKTRDDSDSERRGRFIQSKHRNEECAPTLYYQWERLDLRSLECPFIFGYATRRGSQLRDLINIKGTSTVKCVVACSFRRLVLSWYKDFDKIHLAPNAVTRVMCCVVHGLSVWISNWSN